jgi:hypothetical protein
MVFVLGDGGNITQLKDAVYELLPIAVRSQSEADRRTAAHVLARRAQLGATPEAPVGAAPLATGDYMKWRGAQKRRQA